MLVQWTTDLRQAQKSSLETLTDALRRSAVVLAICEDFRAAAVSCQSMYNLRAVTCAFEICTDTLANEDRLRVHGHWFIEARMGKVFRTRSLSCISFRGVPGPSTNYHAGQVATRGSSFNSAGHYYLLMPKVGAILNYSPLKPFRDFRVSPDWIELLLHLVG